MVIAQMNVINREEIPILKEIQIDGIMHFLGEHRDLKNDERLSKFMPEESNFSISWTRLKAGERLDIHIHPVKSMIIICSGEGFLEGDMQKELKAGDVVMVPPLSRHGFLGTGEGGFHALSIQFENKSLYAGGQAAAVRFLDEEKVRKEILEYNGKKIQQHLSLPIFQMIQEGKLNDEARLNRLLSFLKTWSTYFQKLVMLRFVTSTAEPYAEIAKDHLVEEYGHDTLLSTKEIKDPISKSIFTWFVHQMMVRSDLEKLIIVHLVLESSGYSFHSLCSKHLKGAGSAYFNAHTEHDENHSEMGLDIVVQNYRQNKKLVLETIDEAWEMLNIFFARCYEIVL